MDAHSPTLQIKPRPEFSGILRQHESFAVQDRHNVGNRINGAFDRLVLQAGVELPPTVVLMLCILGGLLLGGAVFVAYENLLVAALFTGLGTLLPVGILAGVRSYRQNKMAKQLPPMIDELARAAKTGRSLEQCLAIVADDTPAPLGTELQHCTRKLQLGVTLEDALRLLPERTGLVSLSVLSTALSVHVRTGGDLVVVLERLSRTLRDRLQFVGRLKAATAASRATAVLMIAVPPLVLAFFVFRDPEYFDRLMNSTAGQWLTVAAVVLQIVGTLLVLKILSDSKRA